MKDTELLARKKRLSAILLHRLNRHFYPLACRSFSLDALSIDQAFAGVAAGLSARDRSMVVRMYVHFRLALAEMFLETEAESSPFSHTDRKTVFGCDEAIFQGPSSCP